MQIDNFHFENNDLKHSVPKSNNLSKKILAYRGSFFVNILKPIRIRVEPINVMEWRHEP